MKRKIISIFMIIIILLNICSFVFAEDQHKYSDKSNIRRTKKRSK